MKKTYSRREILGLGEGKQAPNEPEVVSKMYCTTCHPDAHK